MSARKVNTVRDAEIVRRAIGGERPAALAREYGISATRMSQILGEAQVSRRKEKPKDSRTRVFCSVCGWRGQRSEDAMRLPCPSCRNPAKYVLCGVRPLRPDLGHWRVRLHVSVHKEARRRLGRHPHTRAREIIEEWAREQAVQEERRQLGSASSEEAT